jgi:hypothetical protein
MLAVAGLFALTITARSFWIDEVYSALFAQQSTPAACWHELRAIKGSDPQMPAYIFWIWSCEKLVGDSEFALRAVNFCWLIPALLALNRAMTGNRRWQRAFFLAVTLSPFVWYYLNEARAYTMQFSTSLMLLATVIHWHRNPDTPVKSERGWVLFFVIALFLLCGSSILAMILAGVPWLLALGLLPAKRLRELGKSFWAVWAGTLAVLFLLGLYYLWTLHSGDRATEVATTGWKNLVFIGYELFGFAGLGPGRLEIRAGGLEVFKPYAAALLTYGVLLAALLGLAVREGRRQFDGKKLFILFLAVAIPAGFILAASAVLHFRVLGRHLAALLPVAITLLAAGLTAAWRGGRWGKTLAAGFLFCYLASALSLRFAARHEKDDYRAAAVIARTALARGQTVWWNADAQAAHYYQVPLATGAPAEKGWARVMIHLSRETIASTAPPDVIVTSRPDVYDGAGNLAEFIVQTDYQLKTNFTAFKIWTRPPVK